MTHEKVPWRLLHGTLLLKKNKGLFKTLCWCLQEIVDFVNLLKHVEHRADEICCLCSLTYIFLDHITSVSDLADTPIIVSEIEHQHIRTRIDLILMEPLVPLIKQSRQCGTPSVKLRRRADLHSVLQIVHEDAVCTLRVYDCDHLSSHFKFLLLKYMAYEYLSYSLHCYNIQSKN